MKLIKFFILHPKPGTKQRSGLHYSIEESGLMDNRYHIFY